jgi:hypothetical protein
MAKPKQTHCLRGHERTPENVQKNGTCKLCHRLADTARREKKPSIPKACAKCGVEFTTAKPRQKYCSPQCKHRAKKANHRARIRAKKWYADLTHEETFLIKVLVSRERRKRSEKRKAQSSGGRARSKAHSHKYRARKHGNGGSWTGKQWLALKESYGNRCLGCGRTEVELLAMGRKLVPDHVKPISLGGSNNLSNIQPLCHGDGSSCNMLKSAQEIDYR